MSQVPKVARRKVEFGEGDVSRKPGEEGGPSNGYP